MTNQILPVSKSNYFVLLSRNFWLSVIRISLARVVKQIQLLKAGQS